MQSLEQGRIGRMLACADIVLWEIAMLSEKQRIDLPAPVGSFLDKLINGLQLQVLPITTAIAAQVKNTGLAHGDPADRLITATALAYTAPLVTADKKLAQVPRLQVIW
jgi:PIN domain nuclease of toxin-antitoxin system